LLTRVIGVIIISDKYEVLWQAIGHPEANTKGGQCIGRIGAEKPG
jgi:hypothetical protein